MATSIREARQEDAVEISIVIITAIRETNAKDYHHLLLKACQIAFPLNK